MILVNPEDFGLADMCPITFKLEFLQHSGTFKARGAFNSLLTIEKPPGGFVAASGGNHGVAVAYAARQVGVPAKIFVPLIASPAKLEQLKAYAADVVVVGNSYADALEASLEFQKRSGAIPVHAFDQIETIAGQGTLARELETQASDVDTWLIAVGGGGLIAGAAAWFGGHTKLVGVEPELAPTLTRALEAGEPVDAPVGGIAADSLAPKRIGTLNFPIIRKFVEAVELVTEDEIVRAQEILWRVLRVLVEPGGAAAFAALLAGRYRPRPQEKVGVVLCGANRTLT